ncbi:50s ribosomal protein [Cyclospora cayetanensis]|uniref:50s ribosomal protein n=1 Tax=Cyclospora cayetanensis TaxID=88456 RepID=A0A1D3D928_9EIME|nr:50s ribosomal protein [Cyclospora cayetanensis]
MLMPRRSLSSASCTRDRAPLENSDRRGPFFLGSSEPVVTFIFRWTGINSSWRVGGGSHSLGLARLHMSEKRYKEQLMGKKFTSLGRSSVVKHYRIQGRGGGLPRVRKATGLPANPIVLPMRRLRLSMKGLKTIKKYGVHRAAEKFKLNLRDKRLFAGYSHRGKVPSNFLQNMVPDGLTRAADITDGASSMTTAPS